MAAGGAAGSKAASDLQLIGWTYSPVPPKGLGLLPLKPRSCACSVVTSISTSAWAKGRLPAVPQEGGTD